MGDAAASTIQLVLTIALVFLFILSYRALKDRARRRQRGDHEPGMGGALPGMLFLSLAIGVALHFGLRSLAPDPPPHVDRGIVVLGTDADPSTVQDVTRLLHSRAGAADMREQARLLAGERLSSTDLDRWLAIEIQGVMPVPYEVEGVGVSVAVIVHGDAPEAVRLESRRFTRAVCMRLSWETAMRLLEPGPGVDRVRRGVMLAERCMTAVAQFAQADQLNSFYKSARRDIGVIAHDAALGTDSQEAIEALLRRVPRSR